MKLKKWLENWDMKSLKIKTPFLEMEWEPQKADKDAAWELYIEMLTRITTQELPFQDGDEKTALESVFVLFPLTREVIKRKGRECIEFTKIAVVVLNQIIRPFTAKWHKKAVNNELSKFSKEFRQELSLLQVELRKYTKMLSDMAGVEDLTELEED